MGLWQSMEIGAVVNGQYTVIEHIGRGGMADVWSARDMRLRRLVAIKTIARGLSSEIDPVALFEREARTIAQMEHPHILPIYDFGEYEGSLYIAMRYMTGGSLEDVLQRGAMAPADALRMGQSVAQAMDYAHSNKVVHLDLKPPNILLDSQQMPYLADFGLATALDPEGRARNPGSGTLLYMAPEQLTADVIDRRADIYSFCIMLFHMFTGQLPFEGTSPLAIRQLQHKDELPPVEHFDPDLPPTLTDILRLGTSIEPSRRPPTLVDIMGRLREALFATPAVVAAGSVEGDVGLIDSDYLVDTDKAIAAGDSELLEAVDIYSRARHAWAGGLGRFVLSLSHYLLMAQYYYDAEAYGLTLDEAGTQMLLRGALEYDVDVEVWWQRLDDDSRRLVCLHTIRSGTAPARIRALYRLETLPDDEQRPVIPRLVGQALEVERDPTARIAALRVLGTRSWLVKRNQSFEIQTQFRGRMLTTMTRFGLLLTSPTHWIEAVYDVEIDLLVAEQALDDEDEDVSEFAARTVGRMRSLTGLRHLANAQREGRPGALRALALVRDEAPSLPDVVAPQARLYAWLTNTVRRLTDNPLEAVLRYLLALLGAWIGMGQQVYNTYLTLNIFSLQRWSDTLGFGLMFAVVTALVVFVGDELSRRLRGFWPWWARMALFGTLGVVLGFVAWFMYQLLFLYYTPPANLALIAGIGLALGYVLAALLNLRAWVAVPLAALLTWLPLYAIYASFYEAESFNVAWAAPLGLLVGLGIGYAAYAESHRYDPASRQRPGWRGVILMTVLGGLGGAALWMFYGILYQAQFNGQPITWEGVAALFLLPMLAGAIMGYGMPDRRSFGYVAALVAVSAGLYAMAGWQFLNHSFTVPTADLMPVSLRYYDGIPLAPMPDDVTAILYFDLSGIYNDQTGMIFTVSLPLAFLVALGAYLPQLVRGWWQTIGAPRQAHERGAWLSVALGYMLFTTAVISVFAIFSLHADPIWAISASVWGFLTFIAALATWRWALWGVRALLALATLALVGGFILDARIIWSSLQEGIAPELFLPQSTLIWLTFGLWLAALTWAIWRRKLWGGIGLVALMAVWWVVALFGPVQESYAALAVCHVALLAYTLQPVWDQFEAERFRFAQERRSRIPVMASVAGPVTVPVAAPVTVPVAAPVTVPVAAPDAPIVPTGIPQRSDLPLMVPLAGVPAAEAGPPVTVPVASPVDDQVPEVSEGVPATVPIPSPEDMDETEQRPGAKPAMMPPDEESSAPVIKFDLVGNLDTDPEPDGRPEQNRPTEVDPQRYPGQGDETAAPVIKLDLGSLSPEEGMNTRPPMRFFDETDAPVIRLENDVFDPNKPGRTEIDPQHGRRQDEGQPSPDATSNDEESREESREESDEDA